MTSKLEKLVRSIMTEDEIALAELEAKVRTEVLSRNANNGLKDFHCTLGPEAIKKTVSELADEIEKSWVRKGTALDFDDSNMVSRPPLTNRKPSNIRDFLNSLDEEK